MIMTTKRVQIIMLAGAIRPSPLQAAISRPVLSLPLGVGEHAAPSTVLDAWLRAFRSLRERCIVTIVVKSERDRESLERLASMNGSREFEIEVVRDPSDWRGAAGVARDVAHDTSADGVALVVEAACLPPRSIDPILARLDARTDAVVGSTERFEPAGVYAFRRSVFGRVPDVGYFDIKEQLISKLTTGASSVRLSVITERHVRLRRREEYLDAVRGQLARNGSSSGPDANGRADGPPSPAARLNGRHSHGKRDVHPAARLIGACVIEPGATIGAGAVINESAVLSGAEVGAGAVVSRCVIDEGAHVAEGGRVVETVVGGRALIATGRGGARRSSAASAAPRGRFTNVMNGANGNETE